VGLAGALMGWLVLPLSKDLPSDRTFDWKGACLIVPALTALMAALNEAHTWGLTSPALIGCALLALVLLALFVRAERRAAVPLIDLDLFRHGAFVAGNVAGLLAFAALFGLMFLMPFMFVRVYGDTALTAGLRLSIVPVMLGAIAPVGGALSDRIGSRIVTVAGMLVCAAGAGLLFVALDGTPASLPLVMLALAIFGLGQGLSRPTTARSWRSRRRG